MKFLVGHSNQIRDHLREAGMLEQFDQQMTERGFREGVEWVRSLLEAGRVLMFYRSKTTGRVMLATGNCPATVLRIWSQIHL